MVLGQPLAEVLGEPPGEVPDDNPAEVLAATIGHGLVLGSS